MKLPILRPVFEVDRDSRTLSYWVPRLRRYHLTLIWKITVGMVGHETPSGVFSIEWKTRTPSWKAPDSDWVKPPVVVGQTYDFTDPINPFAGGFISFSKRDGVGIHGTKFPPQTGTASSHGCVRMAVKELDQLWPLAKVGSLVFVY